MWNGARKTSGAAACSCSNNPGSILNDTFEKKGIGTCQSPFSVTMQTTVFYLTTIFRLPMI